MADFVRVTEQESLYHALDKMTVAELLFNMNKEDLQVPIAVSKVIPQIEQLVNALVDKILAGGRLFYLGAGTSGRLGILDASEIPPTYGLPQGIVIGLIAGGDEAIRKPVEKAEDNAEQGWEDLKIHSVSDKDFVIGIAASGTTPYVIGALQQCRSRGISTGSISCNPGSPISAAADFPVEVVVGPEFVTGSTRLKSGTAQKLVLNMISTSTMIRIGRVEDNKMVNMQLSNEKLVDRGTRMVMEELNISDYETANQLLLQYGSVKKAVDAKKKPH
ncbi:N-acetylmuramic acid 6-phosphate etherase [Flavihumibacter fluvii]|uniref:N-acetylmuramic acid 6-phosphate etherase n=1 Tax=Flavihumibacter fluvii TaxID=2838157 RepID=UPI001BDEDAC6|nr:N-acetylmuramic acid 6-phosphate etherase [Flavihumibacter fluvii]ULQ53471.1 N-acetylmuramic acid 6-phosphate etherase [Flavihumibacter fluvii]